MNKMVKKVLVYAGIIVAFLVLSYGFVPQVLDGKVVNQSDISGYMGMAHEMSEWNNAHPDDPTAWTGSMFSGMPVTSFEAPRQGDLIQGVYDFLLTGNRPATYLFVSLLGAFLLMLSLGIDKLIAMGGAVAVTFCSYNMQIIQVGHNSKMQALAFLPWALAGLIFTYRKALEGASKDESRPAWKKMLPSAVLGSVLFGLGISLQVKANHQQITYYLAILIFIYAIVLLVWLLRDQERKKYFGRFMAASGLLLVMGVAGIATNANKLIPIYKYTANSNRGGSELVQGGEKDGGKGVTIDYATAWSYGWEELPNMLIPNFNGGSSAGALGPDSETYQLLKKAGQPNLRQVSKSLPLYWGPQPFTAGPMYMGAITVFLFILGLFLYKGKEKWWLLAGTIIAIFLGLGSNFMWFTKLFYNYAPFYNKFRTVSMALTVLQFTLPMLGFMVLDRIVKNGIGKEVFIRKGGIAFAITCGFCALFMLIPSLAGSFSGAADAGQPDVLVEALQNDRESLLRGDAIRSALFILASFLILFWGYTVPSKAKETFATRPEMGMARRRTAVLLVCVLVLLDVFTIGKRYLRDDDFVEPKDFKAQFDKRLVDEIILEDTDPSYRVLDLSVSTFNDSHPSYWHKSIGGYSPAKLQRYQDLIERHIQPEINRIFSSAQEAQTVSEFSENLPSIPVLNALNTRYIIFGDDIAPAYNESAYGNAWFVNSHITVNTPNEEMDALGKTDLREVAIISSEFEDAIRIQERPMADIALDEGIVLSSYAPNKLVYDYTAERDRLTVFSEIWYPEGWKAVLEDGTEVPVVRADWTLRAALLPAGEHTLTMTFAPQSYAVSRNISMASSLMLIIFLLLGAAGVFVTGRKNS